MDVSSARCKKQVTGQVMSRVMGWVMGMHDGWVMRGEKSGDGVGGVGTQHVN